MIEYGRLTEIIDNVLEKVTVNNMLFLVISEDKSKEFILDLNRIDQIFTRGEGLDGDIIGFYSPITESLTQGESFTYKGNTKTKKTGEPYFLVDTGKMFNSFSIIVDKQSFTIVAMTVKDGEDLEKKWTEFVGLNDESIEKLIPYLEQGIVQTLSKKVFN